MLFTSRAATGRSPPARTSRIVKNDDVFAGPSGVCGSDPAIAKAMIPHTMAHRATSVSSGREDRHAAHANPRAPGES